MCVYFFAWNVHPVYKVIVAGNRDEFYSRESEKAGFWENPENMLAGCDKEQGGAWFAVNREGKFSFITNFRDLSRQKPNATSRGVLVRDYFSSPNGAEGYVSSVAARNDSFRDFNLIAGDASTISYHASWSDTTRSLLPGIYGISNHLLDTPWPKVEYGKEQFTELIDAKTEIDPEIFLPLLSDQTQAPDNLLPDTGVGLEWERMLSPVFIRTENYGTQMSSVLLIARTGETVFLERSFDPATGSFSIEQFSFASRT